MKLSSLASFGSLSVAGLLTAGLLAIPGTTTSVASGADGFVKRDEDLTEIVLVDDDDDDDTNDRSRSRNTGASRSTRDGTRSNFTKVSRDRDKSRSDKTRDWTRDGGDRTRDHSQNKTNDRSRNDTRR